MRKYVAVYTAYGCSNSTTDSICIMYLKSTNYTDAYKEWHENRPINAKRLLQISTKTAGLKLFDKLTFEPLKCHVYNTILNNSTTEIDLTNHTVTTTKESV